MFRIGGHFEYHGALLYLVCFLVILLRTAEASLNDVQAGEYEDTEFAEFEDFDEDSAVRSKVGGGGGEQRPSKGGVDSQEAENAEQSKPATSGQPGSDTSPEVSAAQDYSNDDNEYGVVQDEIDDDFSHLRDKEEFENFDGSRSFGPGANDEPIDVRPLKITDVPSHLRNNWSNFSLEMLMLFGLAVYLFNYLYGKTKNYSLAMAWFDAHRDILEENFSVVGDDGLTQEVQHGVLIKESDCCFTIWCSGRQGCQSMMVQLKLLKRQDAISMILQLFRPKYDIVQIKTVFSSDEMDTFVFAFGEKRTMAKLSTEMSDLSLYCSERKNGEKFGLPSNFTVFSELSEVSSSLIDARILTLITKYRECIDFVHISDQFVGPKLQEGETNGKLPEASKVVIFGFKRKVNVTEKSIFELKPLLHLVFYVVEKVRRFRLTRDAKHKAEKNRLAAQESFLKTTHAQRQEAAQIRREERARERKERLLAEEDPERQRKLEKLELKREMKKKQPRMKQLKIKAS